MIRYVVGFAFSENMDSVVLIKKNRPKWQAGKYNGVGGKVEAGETPIQALVREYWEETGVQTEEADWAPLALQHGKDSQGDIFDLHAFSSVSKNAFTGAATKTDEEIFYVNINAFRHLEHFVSSVPWLVFLAKDSNMRNKQMRVEAYYNCEAPNDQTSS